MAAAAAAAAAAFLLDPVTSEQASCQCIAVGLKKYNSA
jgi:hypothetical protein